jgi:hypothetical protein
MKIKEQDYKTSLKKNAKPAPPAIIVDKTNVEIAKSLNTLVTVLKEKESPQPMDTGPLTSLITELTEGNREDYKIFIEYLSDKVGELTKVIKDRPSSFEFDVRRNNNGFINTILVKPVK